MYVEIVFHDFDYSMMEVVESCETLLDFTREKCCCELHGNFMSIQKRISRRKVTFIMMRWIIHLYGSISRLPESFLYVGSREPAVDLRDWSTASARYIRFGARGCVDLVLVCAVERNLITLQPVQPMWHSPTVYCGVEHTYVASAWGNFTVFFVFFGLLRMEKVSQVSLLAHPALLLTEGTVSRGRGWNESGW